MMSIILLVAVALAAMITITQAQSPTEAPTFSPTGQATNDAELIALQTFYDQMGGSKRWWTYPTNANTWICTSTTSTASCNFCLWGGLTCDTNGYLQQINLANYNLSGTVPSIFGAFTQLTTLILDHSTKIVGTIPTNIFGLQPSTLTTFSMFNTSLAGTIPTELFSMTKLVTIQLGNSKINGTIPTQIGQLSNMITFVVAKSSLSGAIPTEIGSCTKLKNLTLDNNPKLTGTIPSTLYLNANQVKTSNPLQCLGLLNTNLTGSLPTQLFSMTNLVTLQFSNTKIYGSIPPQIGNLTKLVTFSVGNNSLSGTIPTQLGQCTVLKTLTLDNNPKIIGPIPSQLFTLTSAGANALRTLSLLNTTLTGTLPAELFSSTMSKIENILIGETRISGSIPTGIGLLASLKKFSVYANSLTGPIPTEIGKCSKLTYLLLRYDHTHHHYHHNHQHHHHYHHRHLS